MQTERITGMGGHQSARMQKDEWLTPPEIIKALGPFDLDPCAPVVRPWDTAKIHYTTTDNGLQREWRGRYGVTLLMAFKRHSGFIKWREIG